MSRLTARRRALAGRYTSHRFDFNFCDIAGRGEPVIIRPGAASRRPHSRELLLRGTHAFHAALSSIFRVYRSALSRVTHAYVESFRDRKADFLPAENTLLLCETPHDEATVGFFFPTLQIKDERERESARD